MYIVYMAGRPPRQKAKNDARQQLWYASTSVYTSKLFIVLTAQLDPNHISYANYKKHECSG